MTRGTLYEIEKDVENIGTASENDFLDYAGHEFDYVEELPDRLSEAEKLLDALKAVGIHVGYVQRNHEERIPYFDITNESKKAYFKNAYIKLKKMMAEISLDTFVSDDTSWNLRECIDNPYGDAVTNTYDEFQTLDRFMRNASGRYFIGKSFEMH